MLLHQKKVRKILKLSLKNRLRKRHSQKRKLEKEHTINIEKLILSSNALNKILCLIGGIVLVSFLYNVFAPKCVGQNTYEIIGTAMNGLIAMSTLILGYIAGTQAGK